MSHYRAYRRRSNRSRSIGHERALEHIREAEALTRELGGTDKDVKEYFFSLPPEQLKQVLDQYEKQSGQAARAYAEKTLPSWKSGAVHMSGMVAERLFKLLPPIMPLRAKFQLTESLWKHVGPSSNKVFYIGADADLAEVKGSVSRHLEEVVIPYKVPAAMEKRFDWLSQGDVALKQELMNFFRQQEKLLLAEALSTQLPVLLEHLNSEKGALTTHAAQTLRVGKHEVRVIVHEQVSGVSEVAPVQSSASDFSWIWWIAGIVVILLLISK